MYASAKQGYTLIMSQQVSSDAPARLERRPEATAYQVDDLLAKARTGQLRLPRFQRRLKWRDQDRIALFDSLYRGFPIGTLLLWKHDGPDEAVAFGELQVEARKRDDAFYIVDGQQRVATLASTLLLSRDAGDRTVLFDLQTEEFHYGRITKSPAELSLPGHVPTTETPQQVPVHTLFDASRLIEWIVERRGALPTGLVQRALECGKRLREYRIPAYVVEVDDEDVLRTIFDRTNRTGRRLDETDVFTALFARRGVEGEGRDLSHVVKRVSSRGFGNLDESTVLNALRAVMDLPLDRDFTRELKREVVPEAITRTESSLSRAVIFLRDEAMIPHDALCPYRLPIVVLARFFDAFPEPRLRSRMLLRRWLWRASLAQKLGGASASLRQHVDAVVHDKEDDSVQNLISLDTADPSAANVTSDERFNLGFARTRLALCAMAALEPRDLRTDTPIDVARLFGAEPPPDLPVIVKRAGDGLVRTMANRLLHFHISPVKLGQVLMDAAPASLESHAICAAEVSLLARGDEDGFLQARDARLKQLLSEFYRRQAEFGADDSPSLDFLVVQGET
jgi:hypothetical protein